MGVAKKYLDELTYKVIGCAIEVYKHLGPGLLENVFEKCFLKELELRELNINAKFWFHLCVFLCAYDSMWFSYMLFTPIRSLIISR